MDIQIEFDDAKFFDFVFDSRTPLLQASTYSCMQNKTPSKDLTFRVNSRGKLVFNCVNLLINFCFVYGLFLVKLNIFSIGMYGEVFTVING